MKFRHDVGGISGVWMSYFSGGTCRKRDFAKAPQKNLFFSPTLKIYPLGKKMEGKRKGGEIKSKGGKERRKKGKEFRE